MNKTELALAAIKGEKVDFKKLDPSLRRRQACFVSVYVKGELRGCIGNLEPKGPLYQSIIDKAIEAATKDWRFEPISKEELNDLTVEVSVLSPLKVFKPKDNQALLAFLSKTKPGLVIAKAGRRAVFLPQVWEKIATAEEFLRHLCLKAGLAADAWKQRMKFWVFEVER